MRVVAGTAGGIRLTSPRSGLRPTMDRVKAALFSSLAERIPGARVLDLFAGTGALGIEALSRGAQSATFIDRDQKAIAAIQENLRKTRQSGEVIRGEVAAWLSRPSRETFDLILADPPYADRSGQADDAQLLLTHESLPHRLNQGGILVVEQPAACPQPEHDGWRVLRSKAYGASRVTFYQRQEIAPA